MTFIDTAFSHYFTQPVYDFCYASAKTRAMLNYKILLRHIHYFLFEIFNWHFRLQMRTENDARCGVD